MALFSHGITSLVVAECACFSLIFTSFNYIPSLVCVDPECLNWSTSSGIFSVHTYVGRRPWPDAVNEESFYFNLSELFSISYPAAAFPSLSVSCYSSSSRPPRRSISSANCKLQSGRPPIAIEVSKSSALSFLGIKYMVLEIIDILIVLLLSFERNLRHFCLIPGH